MAAERSAYTLLAISEDENLQYETVSEHEKDKGTIRTRNCLLHFLIALPTVLLVLSNGVWMHFYDRHQKMKDVEYYRIHTP